MNDLYENGNTVYETHDPPTPPPQKIFDKYMYFEKKTSVHLAENTKGIVVMREVPQLNCELSA